MVLATGADLGGCRLQRSALMASRPQLRTASAVSLPAPTNIRGVGAVVHGSP